MEHKILPHDYADIVAGASEKEPNTSATGVDCTSNRKLYAKIDRHIVPLAFLCYFLQFLDKVVINYAKVMGLESSLGMTGQDFSWMATAFFIAYEHMHARRLS